VRFEKETQELKAKGYFIMEDGQKSSDKIVAGKKRKASKSPKAKGGKRKSGGVMKQSTLNVSPAVEKKGGKKKKQESAMEESD
jgi:hypothetical protein